MAKEPKIRFPEATPDERALQNEQVQLLRQQRDILSEQIRQQNLLAPMLWGAIGITPKYDKAGTIVGFSQTPDEMQGLRTQIEKAGLERSLAGLRGELPDNPALLRDLRDQEATLNESLRKQLGPGYNISTPGTGALGEFMQRRESLLDASRRGDISLGEALSLSRQQQQEQTLNNLLARSAGINSQGLGAAGALGNVASGYNAPLALALQAREGKFGANALQFQYDADNPFTGRNLFRSFQTDARTFGGAAMGMASTARLKKDIQPEDRKGAAALKKLRDTPLYSYRYTWEGEDTPRRYGPILELSPDEMKMGDGVHVNGLGYSGLLHAGIKELDREVRTLRHEIGGRR